MSVERFVIIDFAVGTAIFAVTVGKWRSKTNCCVRGIDRHFRRTCDKGFQIRISRVGIDPFIPEVLRGNLINVGGIGQCVNAGNRIAREGRVGAARLIGKTCSGIAARRRGPAQPIAGQMSKISARAATRRAAGHRGVAHKDSFQAFRGAANRTSQINVEDPGVNGGVIGMQAVNSGSDHGRVEKGSARFKITDQRANRNRSKGAVHYSLNFIERDIAVGNLSTACHPASQNAISRG